MKIYPDLCVILAEAGIQDLILCWIPVYTGMTETDI